MITLIPSWLDTFRKAASAAAALSGLGGMSAAAAQLTANGDANNFKWINLANGSAAQDSITYGQVIALVNNLDWKPSVRAGTTAALPSYTHNAGVLTASANGALAAQDGVTLVNGNRLLVKDESGANEKYNWLYVVTDVGSAGTPWILTRADDANVDAEVTAGSTVTVTEGTANGDKAFRITTNDTITLGTTAITVVQLPALALDSASNPQALGTAAAGNSSQASPANHVHPTTGLALLAGSTFTGPIQSAGRIYDGVAKTAANFTPAGDEEVFYIDTTSNAVTADLPPATGSGRVYIFIVEAGANTFTIDGNGAETVRNDAGVDSTTMTIALKEARKIIDRSAGKWLQCP